MSTKRKIQRNMINSQKLKKSGCPSKKHEHVYFTTPDIISKQVINNRLEIRLQWDTYEYGTSIISRNSNGFNYEDVGHHKRYFSSPEFMINEYNLPISVSDLINLPIVIEKDYKTKFTAFGNSDLKESIKKVDVRF